MAGEDDITDEEGVVTTNEHEERRLSAKCFEKLLNVDCTENGKYLEDVTHETKEEEQNVNKKEVK